MAGGNSRRFVLGDYTLTRAIEHIDGRVWVPGRRCAIVLARVHTSTAERALHTACPGLLHSIRDIPHSSHTCKNTSVGTRCLRCLLLIRTLNWLAATTVQCAPPFMGQGNIRTVYGTGESSLFLPWEALSSAAWLLRRTSYIHTPREWELGAI